MVAAIRSRVIAASRRAVLASIALNLLVREVFHSQHDATIDIRDTTLLRQLMLGTEGANDPDARVSDLFLRYPKLLHNVTDRHLSDRNIYSAAAIKLGTNLRNHLVVNLRRVITKALADVPNDEERVLMLYKLYGWKGGPRKKTKPPKNPPKKANTSSSAAAQMAEIAPEPPTLSAAQLDFVRECRRILGFTDDAEELTERWMDKPANLPRILAFFVAVNCLLEGKLEEPSQVRPFAILSICKIKRHFVTLDTHSIHGVARDAEIVGPKCSSQAFLEHGDAHWASMVNHAKHLPKGGRFTGTIETDGVSVCIHYMRPKAKEEEGSGFAAPNPPKGHVGVETLAEKSKASRNPKSSPLRPTPEQLSRCRIVVIDPGRTNIIYAVEVTPDGVKIYRLTRAQYYQESGVERGKQQAANWLRGTKEELTKLSAASPKGADLQAFLVFVTTHLETSDARWEEALKPRWAQMHLRLYGGKKRVLAKFFDEIARGDPGAPARPVIIGYGAAKFAPGGKGELSVPTCGVFKACRARFPTHLVDEFRSTKVYHADDSILQGVAERRWKGDRMKTVRGLLWCGSTNETKSKFVNRDFNGAMNIRRCFLSEERPAILDRSKCQGRLQFIRTGRVIRMK
ncbi:hypothetical protein TSOC_011071 [Tetrabaena socialis]|uniref:Uncharacterized protein n=1 Tax=Tetrabaena socialis TaxID=47790 RepID=A0A2J7ZRM7_9CHLO|nr:hypothetical protein TSOC_011071 [Tetrabaena socialis]|eukprot:PNH02916.1 hypothetical protein TSOC_011071 [Tetrabaena socialis]